MTHHPDRTLECAEIALGQIKALALPATPPNYELWYAYAAAQDPRLNETLNELIAERGRASEAEFARVYDAFLSPLRLVDQAERIGTALSHEIGLIADLVEAAAVSSSSYRRELSDSGQAVSRVRDRDTVTAVLQALVNSTRAMEERAAELESALRTSQGTVQNLRRELEEAQAASLTDPLTTVANRRQFDRVLDRAIEAANNDDGPLSLLMFDVDGFKQFNDKFGHQLGDDVLRLIGGTLKEMASGPETPARIGGDEFAVILPQKDLTAARTLAESIREVIASRELRRRSTGEGLGRVFVSFGVAQHGAGDTAAKFLEDTDSDLLRTKGTLKRQGTLQG